MSGQTHTHGYMGMGFPWVWNQRPLPIPTIYPQAVPCGFLYPCQSLGKNNVLCFCHWWVIGGLAGLWAKALKARSLLGGAFDMNKFLQNDASSPATNQAVTYITNVGMHSPSTNCKWLFICQLEPFSNRCLSLQMTLLLTQLGILVLPIGGTLGVSTVRWRDWQTTGEVQTAWDLEGWQRIGWRG